MVKRRINSSSKTNSRRVKTSHKNAIVKRKVAYCQVDKARSSVNQMITDSLNVPAQSLPKAEPDSISFDELKKLLEKGNQEGKRKKEGKLGLNDTNYLEPLLKKWGTDYERMAKDSKMNKMQWTAHQIAKKHKTYSEMIAE